MGALPQSSQKSGCQDPEQSVVGWGLGPGTAPEDPGHDFRAQEAVPGQLLGPTEGGGGPLRALLMGDTGHQPPPPPGAATRFCQVQVRWGPRQRLPPGCLHGLSPPFPPAGVQDGCRGRAGGGVSGTGAPHAQSRSHGSARSLACLWSALQARTPLPSGWGLHVGRREARPLLAPTESRAASPGSPGALAGSPRGRQVGRLRGHSPDPGRQGGCSEPGRLELASQEPTPSPGIRRGPLGSSPPPGPSRCPAALDVTGPGLSVGPGGT